MRLGGEEGLEQPAAVGQRDPPAVVLDAQHEPVGLDMGLDVDPPLVLGRVDRVQDEVEHDLGEVIAHGRRTVGRSTGTSVVIERCLVR